jgi:hypothetical protein
MTGVTVWAWKPKAGEHIGPDSGWSGIGPYATEEATQVLRQRGHMIIYSGDRPSNHHIIGIGLGHDDAEFAEAGRSYAAWCENGDAVDGRWWEEHLFLYERGRHTGPADRHFRYSEQVAAARTALRRKRRYDARKAARS